MAKSSFIVRPRAKVAVMKSILNIDYNRLPARLHPLKPLTIAGENLAIVARRLRDKG